MQKKLLACLLVAPVAGTAMADVVINDNLVNGGTGWSQDGITGSDPVFTGDKVNCPFTAGVLQTTLSTKLNNGKYVINFTSQNNITVEVKSGNTVLAKGEPKDNAVKFEVSTKETEITITVTSADKINGFSFQGAQLALDFDFAAAKEELQKGLDANKLADVAEGDDRKEATDLKTKKAELGEKIETIQGEINELSTESIEVYNKFNLWETPNVIQAEIDDLVKLVEDYNTAVAAENTTWTTVSANRDAKAKLEESIARLETSLGEQKTALDAAKEKYVGDVYSTDIAAAQAAYGKAAQALNDFKKEVETAYADETKKDITVTDKSADITADINAVGTALAKLEADATAYQTLMRLQADVVTAASTAKEKIGALDDVDENKANNKFANYITAQQTEVNRLYQKAMADVNIKNGNATGASDNIEADTKTLNDAKTAIEAVATVAEEYVTTQNEAYTKAIADVAAQQTALNEQNKPLTGVPESAQKEFNDLVAAAQGLITTLKSNIEKAYPTAPGEATPDYSADIEKIEAAIEEIKTFKSKWEPIVEIIKLNNDLPQYIDSLQTASKIPVSTFSLKTKFAKTLTTIQEAVDALGEKINNGVEVEEGDITSVTTAIDETKKNAKNLMDAYKSASDALAEFKTALVTLDENVSKKLVITGSTWTVAQFTNGTTYTALANLRNDFQAELDGLATAEAQVAYTRATELAKNIAESKWSEQVNNATEEFEVASTQTGNYAAVENALSALKEYAAEGEYAGKDTDFSTLETALETQKTAIEGLTSSFGSDKTKPVDTKAWAVVDTELEKLLAEISAKKTVVENLKNNQKVYDEINALFAPALQDKLNELIDFNEDNSLTPAKEYYAKLINGTDNDKSLQAQITALGKDIADALANRTAVAQQKTLTGRINTLKGDIDKMQSDIADNNAKHDSQLIKSSNVRSTIEGYIKDLIERASVAGDATLTQASQDSLTILLTDSLPDVDIDVNIAYGKGESAAQDGTLVKRYDDILAKAEDIMKNIDATFPDLVQNANNQVVGDAKWEGTMADMNKAYNDAIAQYNKFFALTNAAYRDYILPIVKTHQSIYEYSAKIANLKKEVSAWVQRQSNDGKVISATEFAEKATNEANTLIAEIAGKVTSMMSDANIAANKYYAVIYADADAAIDEATTVMGNAGISSEIIEKNLGLALGSLLTSKKLYKENNTSDEFSLAPMDKIANELATVADNINLQTAAQSQWREYYAAAETELEGLQNELKGYVDAGDESLTTLAGYVGDANALNATATGDKNLINNLKTDKASLDEILENARQLVAEKQAASEANEDNKAAAKEYETSYTNLQADLEALKAFANTIAAGQDCPFSAIEGLVSAYNKLYTETYPNSLVEHKDEIDGALKNAQDAINGAYDKVQSSEQVVLNDLLHKTQVAFNNAKVLAKPALDDEKLATWNESIDSYSAEITKLAGFKLPESKDEYCSSATTVETNLSALYVEIMSSYESTEGVVGGNPVLGILTKLDEQNDSVKAVIEAAQQVLEGYADTVKSEFAEKYADLATELEGVKTAYQNEGDKIVLTSKRFVDLMDNIEAEVDALEVNAAAEQKKVEEQAAIEAHEAELRSQIAGYQEQLNDIATYLGDYMLNEPDQLGGDVSRIQTQIDQMSNELDELVSMGKLTTTTELELAPQVEQMLANLNYTGHIAGVDYVNKTVMDAIEVADSALVRANLIPEKRTELENKLEEIKKQQEAVLATVAEGMSDYESADEKKKISLEDFIAITEKAIEDLIPLQREAEAVSEGVYANEYTPGDVNLEPDGKVDVTDVQQVITWVGEGMTYQDLLQENPRQAYAADYNGDNQLNIADAVAIISVALKDLNESDEINIAVSARRLLAKGVQVSADNNIALALNGNEDGIREYAVLVNNATTFVAGQLDLKVSAGMEIVDIELTGRAADHELYRFDNSTGARVIVASMSNAALDGNSGALLIVRTRGAGNLEVDGAVFADKHATGFGLGNEGLSGIDSITESCQNVKERIYNVAGQAMNRLQRGINIIRKSDGTTTKEMH